MAAEMLNLRKNIKTKQNKKKKKKDLIKSHKFAKKY